MDQVVGFDFITHQDAESGPDIPSEANKSVVNIGPSGVVDDDAAQDVRL